MHIVPYVTSSATESILIEGINMKLGLQQKGQKRKRLAMQQMRLMKQMPEKAEINKLPDFHNFVST